MEKIDSAQTPVKRKAAFYQVWTTKPANALNAAHRSPSTSTSKNKLAPEFVQVVSVQECGPDGHKKRGDTYCLRVPETECFAVESGIIVHNCLRYMTMSGIERMKTKPYEKKEETQYYSSGAHSGWMD